MESLTATKIQQAVDEACRHTQERWTSQQPPALSIQRISKREDWDHVILFINQGIHFASTSRHLDDVLGVFVSLDSVCIGFCTFYLSYSTWDGRVIFLDRLEVLKQQDASSAPVLSDSLLSLSLRYTIADIGLKLKCTRFVWQVTERCCVFLSYLCYALTQCVLSRSASTVSISTLRMQLLRSIPMFNRTRCMSG